DKPVASQPRAAAVETPKPEEGKPWFWRLLLIAALPAGLLLVSFAFLTVSRVAGPPRAVILGLLLLAGYATLGGWMAHRYSVENRKRELAYLLELEKQAGETSPNVAEPPAQPDEQAPPQRERIEKLAGLNEKLNQAGFFSGTNVGDSVLSLVNR